MKSFWEKEFTCPFCGVVFRKKMVFYDAVRVRSRDPDLKPNYEGVNPLLYSVVSCPNCYFSTLEDDFEKIKLSQEKRTKVEEVLKNLREKLKLEEREDHIESVKRHTICALVYEALGDKKKTAVSYLRIAWLFRELGMRERERWAMEESLRFFEEFYRYSYYDDKEEPMILFYLGVLNQMLGKKKEAAKWYELLIRKHGDSSIYSKVGRERWQELRES